MFRRLLGRDPVMETVYFPAGLVNGFTVWWTVGGILHAGAPDQMTLDEAKKEGL